MDGSWNGCMARRPVLCSIPRGWITTNRQSFVPLREERAGQSPEGVLVLLCLQCPERQPTRESVAKARQGRAATARRRAGRNKATGLADKPEPNTRESALQTSARTPSSAVARPRPDRTDRRTLALRWPVASTIDCTSRAAGRQHARTRRYARPTRRDAKAVEATMQ